MLVAFFLTPFVVHGVGEERYGIWALTLSITGYYGLLDLGLRAALTQQIARAVAVDDWTRASSVLSSGLAVLSLCGTALAAASVGVAEIAPNLFRTPPALAREISWSVLVIGLSTAAQFFCFPFTAVLTAGHRFDVSNGISVLMRLATAAGTLWTIQEGHGLIGLSVVTGLGNTADYGLRAIVALHVFPLVRPRAALVSRASCGLLFGFAFWNVLVVLSTRLISYTDAVIIGAMISTAAVARFVLAAHVGQHLLSLFVPIGQVLFPAAAELDAKGDADGLRDVYLTGTRLVGLAACATTLTAAVFSEDFFRLWLGDSYVGGERATPVPFLLQVLLVGTFCAATQRIGVQIYIATGRVRLLAGLSLAEAAANVILSVVLIRWVGLMGAALGTAIPAVFFQAIIHPWVVTRFLSIRTSRYLREVVLRLAVTATLIYPVLLGVKGLLGIGGSLGVSGWPSLAAAGASSAVLSAVILLAVGLRRSDRRMLSRPFESWRRARPLSSGRPGSARVSAPQKDEEAEVTSQCN